MLEITPRRGLSPPRRPSALAGFDLAGVGNDDFPLAEGSRGVRVRQAQEALNTVAAYRNLAARLTVDGVYGPNTSSAVETYCSWANFGTFRSLTQARFDGLLAYAARVKGSSTPAVTTTPATAARPVLKQGSSGDSVRQLQQLLNELGWNAGTADGVFGANTAAAVKRLQSAAGLSVDGIVGVNTWAALDRGVRASSGGGSGSGTPTNPSSGSTQTAGAGGGDGFLVKALLGAGIGIGAAWLMAQKKS